ncbi:MAG TPA: hypothetical protein DCQ99_06735 [Nitrospinae bacterium]|nr:hypothetical protein [Nitrospinota bacterium]HBA26354.1 hypothetical protein [Nitrospinota bacterium]
MLLIRIFLIGLILLLTGNVVSADRGEIKRLDIKYTAIVKEIPKNAKTVEIWLPYPQSDRYQEVYNIKVDSPSPATVHYEPEYGNSFLYIKVKNPNEKEIRVTMNYLADRYQAINKIEPDKVGELDGDITQYRLYLEENQYKAVNKDVKKIAQELMKDKKTYYEKVKAIYDYVYDNMEYDKTAPGFGTGDVGRACTVKKGNCIDFHSLFSAVATAAGIPAREVSNFDLPFGEVAPNYCKVGFHCSVEVLLPNYGWIPLDISHAKKGRGTKEFYFGSLDNFRLQIGHGRNVLLSPPQKGQRLNLVSSEPYVEIDGIPYEKTDKDLVYKDRIIVEAKKD